MRRIATIRATGDGGVRGSLQNRLCGAGARRLKRPAPDSSCFRHPEQLSPQLAVSFQRRISAPSLKGPNPCQLHALQKSFPPPPKIFEDATEKSVARATDTLKGVKSAWVKDQKVTAKDGKIIEYRVGLKVTFVLND